MSNFLCVTPYKCTPHQYWTLLHDAYMLLNSRIVGFNKVMSQRVEQRVHLTMHKRQSRDNVPAL